MRDAVRQAFREADESGALSVPSAVPKPPTLADECPVCGAELRVHDRSWTTMRTDAGTLAAANYCGPACYEESERRPDEVLVVLRRRQRYLRGGSA